MSPVNARQGLADNGGGFLIPTFVNKRDAIPAVDELQKMRACIGPIKAGCAVTIPTRKRRRTIALILCAERGQHLQDSGMTLVFHFVDVAGGAILGQLALGRRPQIRA